SEPPLARAIELGPLGLGRRLTDFLDQCRLDPAAILAGDSLAQADEPLMDLVPNETLLLRDGQRALGKSDEVGDMPLLRLATNLPGFTKDGPPVRIPRAGRARRCAGLGNGTLTAIRLTGCRPAPLRQTAPH